jgi:flagellar hook-associated protein 3 FlgL
MRISDRVLTDHVRTNLNASMVKLARIEREIATGRRINVPSDDPAAAATALRHRTDVSMSEQYTRTVQAASSRLSAADTALGGLTEVLQRARELTIKSGAGSLGQDQINSIATEINQLLHSAVQIGNTNFGGQFLFAGTRTTTAPFSVATEVPPAVVYSGNANAIEQDVGQGVKVRVDLPGDQTIQPVMNALIQIRDALTAGDTDAATQAGLAALDNSLDGVLQTRGSVGARVNRLEDLHSRLDDERTNLKTLQSNLEDVDMADTIVQLNIARNVYEASLGAAAKAIQPTLIDFLR